MNTLLFRSAIVRAILFLIEIKGDREHDYTADQTGMEKIKEELQHVKSVKLPLANKRVADARVHGNGAEIHDALGEQMFYNNWRTRSRQQRSFEGKTGGGTWP
jgi:hypothetical protein